MVTTARDLFIRLMEMDCIGFSTSSFLHIRSQEEFDAILAEWTPLSLRTEFYGENADYYDVAEYDRIALFGPHRLVRVRTVASDLAEQRDAADPKAVRLD